MKNLGKFYIDGKWIAPESDEIWSKVGDGP